MRPVLARRNTETTSLPRVKFSRECQKLEWVEHMNRFVGQGPFIDMVIEAEVLTLHINSGLMRVRVLTDLPAMGYTTPMYPTFDMSTSVFFDQYNIVEKS